MNAIKPMQKFTAYIYTNTMNNLPCICKEIVIQTFIVFALYNSTHQTHEPNFYF